MPKPRIAALCVALVLAALPARACKVALLLGIDVSHSIDFHEYKWQKDGLHLALADPTIAATLIEMRAALSVVQWSGQNQQELSIPWFRITSRAALEAFQRKVANMNRPWNDSNTGVGDALTMMISEFPKVPDCARHVIDFSGDGDNNIGPDPIAARGQAKARGITVNGLAIDRLGLAITQYYRNHVIVGRGAFVVTAKGYHDYARAIRVKLFRELLPPSS